MLKVAAEQGVCKTKRTRHLFSSHNGFLAALMERRISLNKKIVYYPLNTHAITFTLIIKNGYDFF